jgi:hypothetical protein
MTPHTTAPDPKARPVVPVCLACDEGDHEQVLHSERCGCPCHGTVTVKAEVAA